MEKITLHLKYKEPIHINGFVVENDTITFGSVEELNKYINGEAAYDILDDSVIKKDNELLLYAKDEKGNVIWEMKNQQKETQKNEIMTYGGLDYDVIDRWQDSIGTYVVGQLIADDGVWYTAKVTDITEQFHGEYEYEFGNDRPSHSDVEDIHLAHISEIDIDRHEAEFGADGSRTFPGLNDEETTQHVRRKCR